MRIELTTILNLLREGHLGLEPRTNTLRGYCSTIELMALSEQINFINVLASPPLAGSGLSIVKRVLLYH